jgi:RimJ/RimL family protein N-acetyltransferase
MLREVRDEDLPVFFEHQLVLEAHRMAGFAAQDRETFMSHWRQRILGDSSVLKRAILFDDQVVGNILSWSENGRRLVGYWLGSQHWGQGLATAALLEFVRDEPARPLWASVAVHNHGSVRVLEKCGFRRVGSSETRQDGMEEHVFRLEA